MQAIRTRYHHATDGRGARISASCEAGRIYVPYDHGLDLDGNHVAAAAALCAKLKWTTADDYPPAGVRSFRGRLVPRVPDIATVILPRDIEAWERRNTRATLIAIGSALAALLIIHTLVWCSL